jgi:hypothetical protein
VGTHLPVEVQAIGLGNEVGIVCLPGEIFVELGLAIKQASPFETTSSIELSNCVETLYVPTRAAYAGGSYEVLNSALEPGSGEMLVEAALRLLRDMTRESVASKKKERLSPPFPVWSVPTNRVAVEAGWPNDRKDRNR